MSELTPVEARLLTFIYSRRRGVTVAFAAKMCGLRVEEAKRGLDRLVAMGLAVKRGKFYSKRGRKGEVTLHSWSTGHAVLPLTRKEALPT